MEDGLCDIDINLSDKQLLLTFLRNFRGCDPVSYKADIIKEHIKFIELNM